MVVLEPVREAGQAVWIVNKVLDRGVRPLVLQQGLYAQQQVELLVGYVHISA